MVAQDSPSSEDLDGSIMTFGQKDTEKEKFEKMQYESNMKVVLKKKCYTAIQKKSK